MQSTEYRLIKDSNWGIAIDIEYTTSKFLDEDLCEDIEEIVSGLYLKLPSKPILNNIQKKFIFNGMKAVSDLIEIKNKSVLIDVIAIEFNKVDFQDDGLYYAFAKLLSELFEFILPEYDVEFDRKLQKYVFGNFEIKEV